MILNPGILNFWFDVGLDGFFRRLTFPRSAHFSYGYDTRTFLSSRIIIKEAQTTRLFAEVSHGHVLMRRRCCGHPYHDGVTFEAFFVWVSFGIATVRRDEFLRTTAVDILGAHLVCVRGYVYVAIKNSDMYILSCENDHFGVCRNFEHPDKGVRTGK